MGKRAERWHLPQLTTKAKIGVGLIVFVFVAAIAIYIATQVISQQIKDSSGISKQEFAAKNTENRQKDARGASADAIASGNDQKAANIYEQAIAAEPDPARKVQLAIDHSKLLYLKGKFDEALEVAKQAEGYSDDKYLVYDWLARLYAGDKQYAQAASYYEKAGSLVNSPTNIGKYTKSYYDRNAANMRSLAGKQ